jgi:TaqI-like C-terminal specificity domain
LSAVQLPLTSPPHRNRQLFSDYYLDVLLPDRPEWRQAEADAARLLPAVASVYRGFIPTTKEAQTERDLLQHVPLERYVAEHGHTVSHRHFTAAPWNLESNAVDDLLTKIRRNGVPLAEYANANVYRGITSGLNEAFLIDNATRARLVSADSKTAEVVRPYLRGQDIKRWYPDWPGGWMIAMKSSGNQSWPWSSAEAEAEAIFQRSFPALYNHFKPMEAALRLRQDKGRFWWELRSCSYYDAFESPKLSFQQIQFHPSYCFDDCGYYLNNKATFIPTDDRYLLALLNSPLMWWHKWRLLPHLKDEALAPQGAMMVDLPIAPPSDVARAEAGPAVERLIAITRADQDARRVTLDWLRTEFSVETPGQRLEAFATLDADTFVDEVRKRRPRVAGRLSPGALSALRSGYMEQGTPVRQRRTESIILEQRLSDLVNRAYGLTPEEVGLLWATAPPRMPMGE